MSNLTILPPSLLFTDPNTGVIRQEWYMFLQNLFSRVGGTNAPTNTDLSASEYADAGIEEIKMQLYGLQDQINSYLIMVQTIEEVLATSPSPYVQNGADYDPANVAITGGTINGATIGATTATTGKFTDITNGNVAALIKTSVAMNNGAAAAAGTILNAPAAGNPTKWIPVSDNGTTRYIPAW